MVLSAPKEGTHVVIQNMLGRKHLNGLLGTVIPHIDGSHTDSVSNRCRVRVHGTPYTVKVMPENLAIFEEEKWKYHPPHPPPADLYELPTWITLCKDEEEQAAAAKGQEVAAKQRARLKARAQTSEPLVCSSRRQQPCGEVYAAIQRSPAARDPRRLRHLGLSFFRDHDAEAHPTTAPRRQHGHQGQSRKMMRACRQDYDWRSKEVKTTYTDPKSIPHEMGGHAAHYDVTSSASVGVTRQWIGETIHGDNNLKLHPTLQALVKDESCFSRSVRAEMQGVVSSSGVSAEARLSPTADSCRRSSGTPRMVLEQEDMFPPHLQSVTLPSAGSSLPLVNWSDRLDSPREEPLVRDESADDGRGLALEHLCGSLTQEPGMVWNERSVSAPDMFGVVAQSELPQLSSESQFQQDSSAMYTSVRDSEMASSMLLTDESAASVRSPEVSLISQSSGAGRPVGTPQDEIRERIRQLSQAAALNSSETAGGGSSGESTIGAAAAIHELAVSIEGVDPNASLERSHGAPS